MSLVLIAGWETGDTYEAVAAAGTYSVTNSFTPPTDSIGVFAFRSNPASLQDGYCYFQPGLATGYVSIYIYLNSLPGGTSTLLKTTHSNTTNTSVEVFLTSMGKINVAVDGSITPALGTTTLSTGTWYLIQLKNPGTTNGTTELLIDGVTEHTIPGTGLTNYRMDYLFVGKTNSAFGTYDVTFENLTVDNTAYNPAHICVLSTTAPGTYSVNTSGSYNNVEDFPADNDTTTVITTNNALAATYSSYALPTNPNPQVPSGTVTVKAVQPYAISRISSNPNLFANLNIGVVFIVNGHNAFEYSLQPVDLTYKLYKSLHLVNPDTAAPWTKEDIDEASILEVGPYFDAVSNGIGGACTQTGIMFAYTSGGGPGPAAVSRRANRGRLRRLKNLL